MSFVLGLDLSLTSTGWAAWHTDQSRGGREFSPTIGTFGTSETTPMADRLLELEEELAGLLMAGPDAVVLELLPRTIRHAGVDLGMAHGVVRRYLRLNYDGRVFDLPPSSLKKYATGHGGAGKARMLAEAVRRLGYAGHDFDEADALWLAAAGAHVLGYPSAPKLPARQVDALAAALEVTPTQEHTS